MPHQIDEEPLTIYSPAQSEPSPDLTLLAQECAEGCTLAASPVKTSHLLNRVAQVATTLRQAHRHFLSSTAEGLSLPYVAEWLLDNFHLVEQALRHIKLDLPLSYYRQLPIVTGGEFGLHPRIYALTHAFILHEECHFEADRYRQLIGAYQQLQPLTIGELWALPTMLRIALLEQLAYTVNTFAETSLDVELFHPTLQANRTLSETDIAGNSINSLRAADVLDWKKFFEEVSLVQQTLSLDPAGVFAYMDFQTRDRYRQVIETLAQRTEQQGGTSYKSAEAEIAVAQQAIALAKDDKMTRWQDDKMPELVEGTLSPSHPLTPSSPHPVTPSPCDLRQPRTHHVGYYLLDEGRAQLEARVKYRPRMGERVQRWLLRHATTVYLGAIFVLMLILLGLIASYAIQAGSQWWMLLLVMFLAVTQVGTVCVNFVNWLVTQLMPPRILPKLDFTEGIPAQCRSMVVTPVLLAHADEVDNLFDQLELHYLRNPERSLTFAILSDFGDAPQAEMPTDAALIASAQARLMRLNQKYPHQPFYFFHRCRLWNASENVWMGWERKRGKLHEFNQLLRGSEKTSFTTQLGDLTVLPQIQYVITLDADTVLPSEGAQRLIGTLAHPLNRAIFDEKTNKVKAGYTVLQPRTAIKPTSANLSLFTRIFSGDVGIDLYTMAVSDAYHDLFGAGIFVGKGIYEVDSFERSLVGRVPENTLLSHDLFEGVHGRAGLVTDIVLYESYPPHYLVNVMRSHRWVRGDWQLLPWLWWRTPRQTSNPQGGNAVLYAENDLPLLARWKISDNLRRSLFPPLLLLLLVAGWTILPGGPLFWTMVGLLPPVVSLLTVFLNSLWGKLRNGERSWRVTLAPVRNDALRWLLFLAFLPFESLVLMDAIATTLNRLFFSRRRMLQWTTAEHAIRLMGGEITAETTFRRMLPSMVLVIIVLLVVALVKPMSLLVAVPFFLLWLGAWRIAFWISRPAQPVEGPLTLAQVDQLHRLARRTWLFYEEFVGPDDNWLPPDHFQESPRGVAAHRTSPTNIGLYLLSTMAAHDLGYLTTINLSLRLRFAFDTLAKLDRYRGHFLNWIDTRTLAPLTPRYISTVDSGNLAACLIALRQGCLTLPHQPFWRKELWQGVIDLFSLLDEAVGMADDKVTDDKMTGDKMTDDGVTSTSSVTPSSPHPLIPSSPHVEQPAQQLHQYIIATQAKISALQDEPENWGTLLFDLIGAGRQQLDQLLMRFIETNLSQFNAERVRDYRIMSERIHARFDNMLREVEQFMPWLSARLTAPACLTQGDASTFQETPLTVAWQNLWQNLFHANPTLDQIAAICQQGQVELAKIANLAPHHCATASDSQAVQAWCQQLHRQLQQTRQAVDTMLETFSNLAEQADRYVQETEFTFLFEPHRQVFHIGYNLDAGRLDNSYYDLLASEARLASLIAIAKEDVPYSHWLHLGRPVTKTESEEQVLLSWSGTMFEYLMPPLFTHSYPGTLLHQSYYSCIAQQVAYGQEKKVPWGISESGFYTFDAAMNYQYYAFGVPGLGFKREQGDDLVITPYASLLALPFLPQTVLANLEALRAQQMIGRYGLYEAADYTQARLGLGQQKGIVRSYMAHHQGMIFLSIANYLQDKRMISRFHADARIKSVEMLLQEQVPHTPEFQFPHEEEQNLAPPAVPSIPTHPWRVANDTPLPLVHYLSNGRYSLLITNSGAGYSQWNDLQLTRWQPDATLDADGSWIYLQDLDRNSTWSATRQPRPVLPGMSGHTIEQEEVTFHPHMVKFVRLVEQISMHTEVGIAVEDDVEIRRVTLTNLTDQARHLRLTSYGEVVLAPAAADRRHQAFVKLFVESEFIGELGMLLFRRRPRAASEDPRFLAHMIVLGPGHEHSPGQQNPVGELSYESNRANFLGRGGTARSPWALQQESGLAGHESAGRQATLDPVMALSQELQLAPHATLHVAFLTLTAPTRPALLALARRYQPWDTIDRAFMHARNEAEGELRQLDLPSPLLEQMQMLLSLLLYPHPARRALSSTLSLNQKGQSGLWAYGISGDYPILLVRINDDTEGELLHHLLLAHTYWRRRGLQIDLVIFNQQPSNYGQEVQNFIHRTIRRLDSEQLLNQRGGLFVLYQDQLSEADRILLQSAARVVLHGEEGLLQEQLRGLLQQPVPLPYLMPAPVPDLAYETMPPVPRPTDLHFDNGIGGFTPDGREYVIYLEPEQYPPAPWSNVIANPDFGTLVTESGGGYSWAKNSGENRLTSWRNDPVSDLPSEALYLRDEETKQIWSPTPLPSPADAPYLVRHGAGYTSFEHHSHQLKQHLRLFVPPDAPVKIIQLRLENTSQRPRRITATFYAEWVLGVERGAMQQYILPEYEASAWTLLARNPYNSEFGERVAFVASSKEPHGLTGDRSEFLGRLGDLHHPAALERVGLTGRVEAGLDPCAAIQLHIDLPPEGSEEIYFLLGQTANREEALQLVRSFWEGAVPSRKVEDAPLNSLTFREENRIFPEGTAAPIATAWQAVQSHWDAILGTLQVETPDEGLNFLLNRWLLYQSLSCRLWGRSALYQSSGAYGFRDQLQDVMSLIHARPDLVRQHIIESAHHQFEAGDVLHWWHPPSGRGVRTRISDDLLWLPYVTAHYVRATGDLAILETQIPFLHGDPLRPGEEERYAHYSTTSQTLTGQAWSLFEHCRRALHKGTTAGKHGLPLMGGGDWNDGMNRVGIHGQGESVWLGWFLCSTLNDFAGLCEAKGEAPAAVVYRQQAAEIHKSLEKHAWDGDWYQRAWYDDGIPLGSQQGSECQIDSIAQSWSVLSGLGERDRSQRAMQAVLDRLVNRKDGLILLFTPPFDKTSHDPGYIKGYLPGIRENGGQYTHAAIWTVWAFAQLGQGDLAAELFTLISPISHGDSAEKIAQYKVEPYVVAADIYGVAPQTGRGGWTWYTGSAGWMYRLGIEAMLGVRREGNQLWVDPCVPKGWPGFAITYRVGKSCYRVQVENPQGVNRGVAEVWVDGVQAAAGAGIVLVEDGGKRVVRVVMG